jgi:hypothetical protein
MTIGEMHYDFKQKLNAIDSQKYTGLKVPEIDWKLNEAQEVYVKIIADPEENSKIGFEVDQRSIDDIRTVVIDQQPADYIVAQVFDESSYFIPLPPDYWFLANVNVIATKGTCVGVELYNSREVQHDDKHEYSPFDKSSFEWRISNYRYNNKGIRFFTDTTFSIDKVGLEYLTKPTMMHNAKAYIGGTYNTVDGVVLVGSQDCLLPEQTHRDIVDLAVLIAANDLSLPNYTMKKDKLNITKQQ